jgi:hypothetical protein
MHEWTMKMWSFCLSIYLSIYLLVYHLSIWLLFSLKRERNPVIWESMGEPGGLYAKWNKPGIERQIQHNLTHVESEVELIDAEGLMAIGRGGEWGEMGYLRSCWFKGTIFCLDKSSKFKSSIVQCGDYS